MRSRGLDVPDLAALRVVRRIEGVEGAPRGPA